MLAACPLRRGQRVHFRVDCLGSFSTGHRGELLWRTEDRREPSPPRCATTPVARRWLERQCPRRLEILRHTGAHSLSRALFDAALYSLWVLSEPARLS